MATTFQRPVNNFKSTLSAQHTSGSGTLALQTGDGALLGALASNQVYRITAVMNPGASETIVGIFEATGLSTDTLSGVTAVEGYADSTIAISTPVQVRPTAKTFTDIQTAVNALENAVITESSVTGTTTISSALSSMGKYYLCSGTSANYTVTLPTVDSTYDGMTIGFRMDPALTKLVTITGTGTQTIDGTLARVLMANETCVLEARGSKWFKLSGRTVAVTCRMRQTGVTASYANGAAVQVPIDTIDFDMAAPCGSTSGNSVTAPRPGRYLVSHQIPWLTVTSAGRYIAVVGLNTVTNYVAKSEQYAVTGGGPFNLGTLVISLAAGDVLMLSGLQLSGGTQTTAVGTDYNAPMLGFTEIPQW